MNANTEIDLDTLHDQILQSIRSKFPDLNVDDYRSERDRLVLPACLVELVDLDADPEIDPGTEQLAVLARFEARVILGFKTANVKREIRKAACALAAFVHNQRFGLPIGPAEVLTISPDNFSPELDQFEIFRVEWQQALHLGSSVWKNDGTIPTHVYLGISPDIGPPNVDKYVLVAGGDHE